MFVLEVNEEQLKEMDINKIKILNTLVALDIQELPWACFALDIASSHFSH